MPSGGEFKAVIAADTLFPEGSGQSLSQEDQDFIWEVSLALSKAYEAAEGKVCVGGGWECAGARRAVAGSCKVRRAGHLLWGTSARGCRG